MREDEIKQALTECGLPVAYREFPEGEAPPLPYVVWYVGGKTNFPADGENYYGIKQVTVELYSRYKDTESEMALEAVLDMLGIWSMTEAYIDSEKCYQVAYYLEV